MRRITKDKAESRRSLDEGGRSGKKYKKCGLINAEEHQKKMMKK